MEYTLEELRQFDHIPTEEVQKDIEDTEKEIKDLQDEHSILMRNPQENKLRIYIIEGNINRREEFIEKLNKIIEIRKF